MNNKAPTSTALPTLSALHKVIGYRFKRQLREIGRNNLKGKETHPDLLIKAERSRYLLGEASKALSKLTAAVDAYMEFRAIDDAVRNSPSQKNLEEARSAALARFMERMDSLIY